MTDQHDFSNGRRPTRIAGRSGPGGVAQVRELQLHCDNAMRSGANFLDIDLTTIDHVDANLIGFLAELLRHTRERRVTLRLRPSLALDGWLATCGLDCCLRPMRAGAA